MRGRKRGEVHVLGADQFVMEGERVWGAREASCLLRKGKVSGGMGGELHVFRADQSAKEGEGKWKEWR